MLKVSNMKNNASQVTLLARNGSGERLETRKRNMSLDSPRFRERVMNESHID